jgi:hypothetical protein
MFARVDQAQELEKVMKGLEVMAETVRRGFHNRPFGSGLPNERL